MESPKSAKMSRRGFLSILGNGAVALGLAKTGYDNLPESSPLPVAPDSSAEQESTTRLATEPIIEQRAEAFADEIRGYASLLPLRFDEVQFVGEQGAPIDGGLFKLNEVSEDPGPLDQGIPIKGIRPAWLDAARLELRRRNPNVVVDLENDIPKPYHVATQFRRALAEYDEPKLIAGIQSGAITRYVDIVNYFSEKPVKGAEEYTRREYVQEKITFTDSVPVPIQNELKRIIPALCVQESGFNNDLTSQSGARGIFQFMPETWADYNDDPAEMSSLRSQVEVAGRFFSKLYSQLLYHCGKDALYYLEIQSPSQESFLVEVITPLMIEAFNGGAKRIGDAVKVFVTQQIENDTLLLVNKPFDLFASIIDVADKSDQGTLKEFGTDSRQYAARIYGHALALQTLRA